VEVARAPDLIIPAAVVTGAPYLMQARVPEPSRLLLIPAALFRDTLLLGALAPVAQHQLKLR